MIFANKKFSNPIKIIKAFDSQEFKNAFDEIEKLRHNYYLLGYIRYEAKNIFLGYDIKSDLPLLYFEVFEQYEEFTPNIKDPVMIFTEPEITYEKYAENLSEIKNQIAEGNTYQVNYTYNHLVNSDLKGLELYQALLQNQTTPYNAYIKNDYEEILSFSPELFFELKDGVIRTKPMKGTIKRSSNEEEDAQNIKFLSSDVKNRAENVMIVDLLRNDLGKIAKTGSVKVDRLFEIETHKTLHQMTSEVSAELQDNIDFYKIFEAVFPCGSVTGAPKISTMQIIDRLELGKRDVYCGAIGLISPREAVFSVPIRILQKNHNEPVYRCRVGGAIVWDSDTKDEWRETLTKIKFLQTPIQLVETLKSEGGKFISGDLHFARMKNSAQELGFEFNENILSLEPKYEGMARVLLSKDGIFEVQYLPFSEPSTDKVVLSKNPVNSKEKYLRHKTTFRPWYEKSMKKIKAGEIYDEIFFNEKNELTEGARSNILVEIDGVLYTPPLECGILNGVLRQKIIAEGQIQEKVLYLEDLRTADAVFCINSLRGIRRVKIDFN